MSTDYLLSIAHGVIVTKNDMTLLSFFAQFSESDADMDVFFDDDATLRDVEVPIQEALGKAFGEDIAMDFSFDQISGSIEESLVFFAPSTFQSLTMRDGNSFPAFNVNKSLRPTSEENKALLGLVDALGFDEAEIGPAIWGSIL